MQTTELVYHVINLLMGILLFVMTITAPSPIWEFILKVIAKVSALYVVSYAVVHIFRALAII